MSQEIYQTRKLSSRDRMLVDRMRKIPRYQRIADHFDPLGGKAKAKKAAGSPHPPGDMAHGDLPTEGAQPNEPHKDPQPHQQPEPHQQPQQQPEPHQQPQPEPHQQPQQQPAADPHGVGAATTSDVQKPTPKGNPPSGRKGR
jgi:hypothetical protein